MARRTLLLMAVSLAVLASPGGPPSARAVPAALLLVGPGEVLHALDALTRRDAPTAAEATVGATVSGGKLLVARTRMDVKLERSSLNWRGRVVTQLVVPSEVTYTVDLRAIRPEHVRVDGGEARVRVAMPPPRVEDVIPALPSARSEDHFLACRTKLLDRKVAVDLQNEMLRKDYQARARAMAEAVPARVHVQAREALADLLVEFLTATGVKGTVVVE